MTQTIVAGIVLFVTILAGWTWRRGAKAKAELAARYPAPGKLVDVGGYRLHINCQGQGSPTVVIEPGNGDFSLCWSPIQREVAKFTRVCTYDRAGLGWSDCSPRPRTAHNLVEDLHTLLIRSGVEPPYVLVGHSLGGPLVRLYAHEHPDQVAGMVLVDSAHEEEFLRAPEAVKRLQANSVKMMNGILRLMQAATTAGVFALVPRLYPRQALSMVPEEARETYRGLTSADAKCVAAIREEYGAYEDHFAAMRAAHITALGDIPLIVLSHGKTQQIPGLSAEVSREFEQISDQLHVELTAQSPNGKRIIAEQSGHYIQLDQPDLVIDAIREVVEAVRPI
ncbi:MAG: alpha/beta hydrolase [Chloroflexi bacterium]|nr:alpha/beta hydrolase [Chloroflexota bacterium]